jgi:hypothetical protein
MKLKRYVLFEAGACFVALSLVGCQAARLPLDARVEIMMTAVRTR